MKNVFRKIWKLALPYQDSADNKGHAKITLNFVLALLKKEAGREEIVIPAIILHDIGYSQLSEREKFLPFILKVRIGSAKDNKIKEKHQEKSVELAKNILKKVKYNKKLIGGILKIISQHDTGKRFLSKEDGLVKDADKLWRFSKIGFSADIRRLKITRQEGYERLKQALNKKELLFFSESAKQIAKRKLTKIKNSI